MATGNVCLPCLEDFQDLYGHATDLSDYKQFSAKYEADGVHEEFETYQENKTKAEQGQLVDFARSEAGTILRTVVRVKRKGRLQEDNGFRRESGQLASTLGGIPSFQFFDEDGNACMVSVFPDDEDTRARNLRECEVFTDVEVYCNERTLEKERCYTEFQGKSHLQKLRASQSTGRPLF